MKNYLCLSGLLVITIFAGCATQERVSRMEGHGRREVFKAPYEVVWRAAVDAAQSGELNVITADKARGYIGAKRGMQIETMGENVGVWVTRISPQKTQVEVVSRQAGLPVAWFKNWENQILNGVAANLTRESYSQGELMEEPSGAEPPVRDYKGPEGGSYPGRTYHVPMP